MRIKELTIYSQYFRFLLEDNQAIAEREPSPYGPVISYVIYDNERQTISCNCKRGATPCEHKAFIHEVIDKEKDSAFATYLNDCREPSAQTITIETINRIRGAFAREYNLAKGVVQYPERRLPLGWEGSVPGWLGKVRVIEKPNRPNTFAIYELDSDEYSTVEGISIPQCKNKECKSQESETFCKHEAALIEAVFAWRNGGFLPMAQEPKREKYWYNEVTKGDLTMVEKAEPIFKAESSSGRWITIPAGFDLEKIARERMEQAAREEVIAAFQRTIFDVASYNSTVSEYTVGIDPAKFKEDIDKAKKLLEKKEEPKPEKPAKPRTRFTDLEL